MPGTISAYRAAGIGAVAGVVFGIIDFVVGLWSMRANGWLFEATIWFAPCHMLFYIAAGMAFTLAGCAILVRLTRPRRDLDSKS
jgi:hypothetical protein